MVSVNSTVTFQVNVGPKKATIPNDLVGKSLTDATKALKESDEARHKAICTEIREELEPMVRQAVAEAVAAELDAAQAG